MAKFKSIPQNYPQTLDEIKRRVRVAQYEALKTVNRELVTLYWDIGSITVRRKRLRKIRTGMSACRSTVGVSGNRRLFAQEYVLYDAFLFVLSEKPKTATLVAEIG